MIRDELVRTCTCERCGRKFMPRVALPKQCPYCHSLLLHVPKRAKEDGKEGGEHYEPQ
jgi:predicted Zn-ribbon and HTH transcriptional regulator